MAPVIWGLDLKEMQWYKFKSSYMFGNRDYHLRRTKFVVYQLAMILCVCSESVGTAALSDYVKEQNLIENLHSSARVHNDSFVGMASYNIFVGIYVATIFGAGFFFDLFFPERYEPANIRWAWRICAVIASVMCLADALGLTVIVARYSASITANNADALAIAQHTINPPLKYSKNGRAIASVVLLWPGWVFTVVSTIVLWMSYKHNETYGPKSDTALARDNAEKQANGIEPSVTPSVHSVNFARSRSQSTRRSRQAGMSRQTSTARSTRQVEPTLGMEATAEETV